MKTFYWFNLVLGSFFLVSVTLAQTENTPWPSKVPFKLTLPDRLSNFMPSDTKAEFERNWKNTSLGEECLGNAREAAGSLLDFYSVWENNFILWLQNKKIPIPSYLMRKGPNGEKSRETRLKAQFILDLLSQSNELSQELKLNFLVSYELINIVSQKGLKVLVPKYVQRENGEKKQIPSFMRNWACTVTQNEILREIFHSLLLLVKNPEEMRHLMAEIKVVDPSLIEFSRNKARPFAEAILQDLPRRMAKEIRNFYEQKKFLIANQDKFPNHYSWEINKGEIQEYQKFIMEEIQANNFNPLYGVLIEELASYGSSFQGVTSNLGFVPLYENYHQLIKQPQNSNIKNEIASVLAFSPSELDERFHGLFDRFQLYRYVHHPKVQKLQRDFLHLFNKDYNPQTDSFVERNLKPDLQKLKSENQRFNKIMRELFDLKEYRLVSPLLQMASMHFGTMPIWVQKTLTKKIPLSPTEKEIIESWFFPKDVALKVISSCLNFFSNSDLYQISAFVGQELYALEMQCNVQKDCVGGTYKETIINRFRNNLIKLFGERLEAALVREITGTQTWRKPSPSLEMLSW